MGACSCQNNYYNQDHQTELIAEMLRLQGQHLTGEPSEEIKKSVLNAGDFHKNMTKIEFDINKGTEVEVIEDMLDYRKDDTPIRNQGSRGTCTAFGTTAVIEHMYKLKTAKDIQLSEEALWSFYGQPIMESAISAAQKHFLPLDSVYPYNTSRAYSKSWDESTQGLVNVANFKAVAPTMSAIIAALGDGYPLVLAFNVNRSFMNLLPKAES